MSDLRGPLERESGRFDLAPGALERMLDRQRPKRVPLGAVPRRSSVHGFLGAGPGQQPTRWSRRGIRNERLPGGLLDLEGASSTLGDAFPSERIRPRTDVLRPVRSLQPAPTHQETCRLPGVLFRRRDPGREPRSPPGQRLPDPDSGQMDGTPVVTADGDGLFAAAGARTRTPLVCLGVNRGMATGTVRRTLGRWRGQARMRSPLGSNSGSAFTSTSTRRPKTLTVSGVPGSLSSTGM
jgi:hypothetical protein